MPKRATTFGLTRRGFLAVSGALAVGTWVGCGPGGSNGGPVDRTKAYRLSTRGVGTASNAAKAHAANWRFVSPDAAAAWRAHPGDRSRIVAIDITPETWQVWFGQGRTRVDLRSR